MANKESSWEYLKSYINKNEIIIKKDLRNYMDYTVGVDAYICYLMNADFLTRIGRGKYKRLKKLEDQTVTQMRLLAYDPIVKKRAIREEKIRQINKKSD